jgi:hypothetical protein
MARQNALPYEGARNGERALSDTQRVLGRLGCEAVGHMKDFQKGVVFVHFRHRGREVQIEASLAGYAAAYLKAHPWRPAYHRRQNRVEYERAATELASHAVCSILRDWIKGQVTAVETGVLSFEGAFLGQLVLSSGETIERHVRRVDLLPALPARASERA